MAVTRQWPPLALAAIGHRVESSPRKLVGIALILLLIAVWAAFVASLAQVVGRWPVLIQAAFYLCMGIVWIIPLKPLVRWIQTGSFRVGP
jgi:predicted membrane channel-forming protein YqfA (hemolysin III family)